MSCDGAGFIAAVIINLIVACDKTLDFLPCEYSGIIPIVRFRCENICSTIGSATDLILKGEYIIVTVGVRNLFAPHTLFFSQKEFSEPLRDIQTHADSEAIERV